MSENKQQDHDKLLAFCDKLNADFQRDGIPLAVIPLRTLLQMQAIVQQHQATVDSLVAQSEHESAIANIDPSWGVDIGLAGGSPRPEHVHLCRDTAQDILNSKRGIGHGKGN